MVNTVAGKRVDFLLECYDMTTTKNQKCSDHCPCQHFQSDDEKILSLTIKSDSKANALISWLAGTSGGNSDNDSISYRCKDRLRASITILNAIRDACRPFLENINVNTDSNTQTATRSINKASTAKIKTVNCQPSVTYEDSFPPLSFTSAASSPAPTLLVGRKKKKGQKNLAQQNIHLQPGYTQDNATHEDSFSPPSISSATDVPTVLVGRKKKKKNIQRKDGKSHNEVSVGNFNTDKTFATNRTNRNDLHDSSPKSGNIMSSLSSQKVSETQNDTSTSKSLVNESVREHIEKDQLKRLAAIYCAIVESHLAPFILLELHLLMRLISLSDTMVKSKSKTTNNNSHVLAEIFHSEACCIFFVSEALSSLEGMIIKVGYETIKMLVILPALQLHCPKLIAALRDTLEKDKTTLIFETGQTALGSDSKTPHLTLPFDYERDSRHNYRSVDLSRLFKEREELRDSFLYQLRAFQEVRGKLVGNEESENVISSIKREVTDIMKNVSPGNLEWFVNFFCDLLLQIGLLPVGETDSEVLKQITDKKRLQKLHMRFTSKSGLKNKSSRKLSLDHKNSSINQASPEQSFQGHQEFFFIVLQAGDSYRFSTHLKRTLALSISEMSAMNETKGLCLRISKLQLIAKFLGLLVFGPNWGMTSEEQVCISDTNSLSPLDLKARITSSWNDYRLVIDIPWIVKFLSMMRWDASSRKQSYYVDIFALLRAIKLRCRDDVTRHLQHNMLFVNMHLEALFHDTVGLIATQKLPIPSLPLRTLSTQLDSKESISPTFNQSKQILFDTTCLWFSKQFLKSIPYFDDLFQLLSDLTTNNGRAGNCTKKVRPRSISLGTLNSSQKYVSRLSLSGDVSPTPWSSSRAGTPADRHGIKERLIDSFFHQHKVLQELCEVIVDKVIKNASFAIKTSCIQPMFIKGGTDYEEYFNSSSMLSFEDYNKMLQALGEDCKVAGDKLIRETLSKTIKDALQLLAPPDSDSQVLEIASSLAVSHAFKLGEEIVRSAVNDQIIKLGEEFVRKEAKVKAGVPLQNRVTALHSSAKRSGGTGSIGGERFQSLADLITILSEILERDIYDDTVLSQLNERKQEVIVYAKRYFIGCEHSLQTIRNFEALVISCISSFFAEPESFITTLRAAVQVVDILSLLNMKGYLLPTSADELESLFCDVNNMKTLMHYGCLSSGELGDLFSVMIEGSLIKSLSLEDAFLHLIRNDDHAKEVALSLFRSHNSNGQTIMVRLRKLLM